MHSAGMLAVAFALLGMTAFFNLAEMALVAARASKLDSDEGDSSAAKVRMLKKRPGLFLAAIRAGDQVTDLLTGAFVVTWMESSIHMALHSLPAIGPYASAVASVAAFLVVTYIFLVFADLAPKSIALNAPERWAKRIASPLNLLILVARPFFRLLEVSNAFLLRLLGVEQQSEERITEGEIRRTLSKGLSSGALAPFERSLMERVLDLDRRSVRTILTSRRDLQSLRVDASADELKHSLLHATASLLLVTQDRNLDRLAGVISRADALTAIAKGEAPDIHGMMMPISYVTEHASVLSIFEVLKTLPSHMAGVMDEFGSLLGIVTLADVLEAIAGDVAELEEGPVDNEKRPFARASDGAYVIQGGQPVDDIVEAGLLQQPARRSYKTMAGFVVHHLRRIPSEGEALELPKMRIEIAKVRNGAVEELRLIPKSEEPK